MTPESAKDWTGPTSAPAPMLNEIASALAKAQLDMTNPRFDTQNPFFKNRYASLAAVRDAVVPALAKHGLCLTQDLRTSEGAVSCTTILTHASGQQMSFGPYTLPVSKQDAQGYGSASTYARRYHLMAVCGVVGDADDDAEAAVNRGNGEISHPPEVLTPEKRNRFLPDVVKAIEARDVAALKAVVDRLNEGEQRGVWSFLNTKQKTAAREMMQRKEVDQETLKADEYVKRFREALDSGIVGRVAELHEECNAVPEFYLEVSTLLMPAERKRINEAIAKAQKA